MKAIADNDVLFKGACYDLLGELFDAIPEASDSVGILGAARFVLASKIQKKKLKPDSATVLDRLLTFMNQNEILEPTDEERVLAAELESLAQETSVALDSGESQLCSILVIRCLPLMVTGDKRAIAGMEILLDAHPKLGSVCGKVKCLEQLVSDALLCNDEVKIKNSICSQFEIDKALSICFGCASNTQAMENTLEGLDSYIRDLRKQAGRVLSS